MGLDWDKISLDYESQIKKEIAEGKQPVEAFVVDEKVPSPPKRTKATGTGWSAPRISRPDVRRLHNAGKRVDEIAEELKCSDQAVRKIIRNEFGLEPKFKKRGGRKPRAPYSEVIAAIEEHGDQSRAAESLGMSRSNLQYILRKEAKKNGDQETLEA